MNSKTLQRTMKKLKDDGWTVHKTEMPWNKFSKVRQDFGGFADCIAYKEDNKGCLAINACTDDGGVQKHINKFSVLNSEDKNSEIRLKNIRTWLKAGNQFEIWGWGKRGGRGERKLWTLRKIPFFIPFRNETIAVSLPETIQEESEKPTTEALI